MTRGGMTAAAAVRQIVEKGLQVKGRDLVKKTVAIGKQSFAALRENDYFYIDKTDFIRQWWESGDDVTLIARPRRFGKTLKVFRYGRMRSSARSTEHCRGRSR